MTSTRRKPYRKEILSQDSGFRNNALLAIWGFHLCLPIIIRKMQVIPRFRYLLFARNSLNFSQVSSFHSTPICYDKRKKKSNSGKGPQVPSKDFNGAKVSPKNHTKFVTRLKRADNKRALKSLFSLYADPGTTFQNDDPWKMRGRISCDTDSTKKRRPKSEQERAEKIHNQRMRRKFRKKYHGEDDDPETIFEATLGGRFYTWSFESSNGSSRRSSPRFDWRDAFRDTNASDKGWDTFNEPDYKEKTCNVGLPKDRALLGLSPKGPLQMKDVKNAFHLSALKWHPDKHQGPTQILVKFDIF
ncbi:uncharacterized protein LOC141623329 isoform X2 [Silene latifolia]|uniref:uncharacterized protein LOC141623329 isoform X2 n=1 Tax=Silene latifolia TaxID=37657 RepID=UPI003D76F55F